MTLKSAKVFCKILIFVLCSLKMVWICTCKQRECCKIWFMGSYIKLYFIFTNGTFTLSRPTYAFLFISHPVPETSILSKLSEATPSNTVASSPSLPPSFPHPPSLPHPLSLSLPPSLHPRSVYSFDFSPRFIRSIPIRSTPPLPPFYSLKSI